MTTAIQKHFTEALNVLTEQVKNDRSVLAAVLCGSLSHDTVWEKSDIDLLLITADDKKPGPSDLTLYADGVCVHTSLVTRSEFRKVAEKAIYSSFTHSYLAKGRLLYTHDSSLEELFERFKKAGDRDLEIQLLRAATAVLPAFYKAQKWLITRGDLDYTALWVLYAATPLAQVEVIHSGQLVGREVILQAMELNPGFFKQVYTDLLNRKKALKEVQGALEAIKTYLQERASKAFRLILDHLEEVGEARSCTEIEDHFKRNFDIGGTTIACEYLADQGMIGKASTPVQLTKKSNISVQEVAFFSLSRPPDEF